MIIMAENIIKSYPSNEKSFVIFINSTTNDIDLLWYDFEGRQVRYVILASKMGSPIDTFSKHPWGCVDHKTAVPLLLNNNFTYYPLTIREVHQRIPSMHYRSPRCGRLKVYVSVPMFSLLDLSCHSIMRHLKNEDEVENLQIPRTLKDYLHGFYSRKRKYTEELKPVSALM